MAEALEERRRRHEERARESEDDGEGPLIDSEEPELDLESVGEQTRRLFRSLTTLGAIVAIGILWKALLPIDDALAEITIYGGVTVLGIAQASIILLVTATLARNLPGLLELGGLRTSSKDAGARYAIATLCQYLVVGVGGLALFGALGLDWSRFGWIAGGLSVGIGFGMQEIVANFVCGIILLFERPMRVGDVVTIDNVTGTVTKIRMRATTITNWDRKEFVVPNKQFITGTLMNWTLSSPVNRLVLPVGIAYGSDIERARQILLDVAEGHPRVMDDPAPVAAFEEFADSSLNLYLRCFLPDMDGRVKTTTELNIEIDRRFKEAGIEIPFPQRDLHLRSSEVDLGQTRPSE